MKRFWLLLLMAVSLRCFSQLTEDQHREEMSTGEILDWQGVLREQRMVDDKARQIQSDICKAHGADAKHSCELYDQGYVVITNIR